MITRSQIPKRTFVSRVGSAVTSVNNFPARGDSSQAEWVHSGPASGPNEQLLSPSLEPTLLKYPAENPPVNAP